MSATASSFWGSLGTPSYLSWQASKCSGKSCLHCSMVRRREVPGAQKTPLTKQVVYGAICTRMTGEEVKYVKYPHPSLWTYIGPPVWSHSHAGSSPAFLHDMRWGGAWEWGHHYGTLASLASPISRSDWLDVINNLFCKHWSVLLGMCLKVFFVVLCSVLPH